MARKALQTVWFFVRSQAFTPTNSIHKLWYARQRHLSGTGVYMAVCKKLWIIPLCGAFGILGLLAGFVPQAPKQEVRRPLAAVPLLAVEQQGKRPLDHMLSMVRGSVALQHKEVSPTSMQPEQAAQSDAWLQVNGLTVDLVTSQGTRPLTEEMQRLSLVDGLNKQSRGLNQLQSHECAAGPLNTSGHLICLPLLKLPLPEKTERASGSFTNGIMRYAAMVNVYVQRFGLSPELIYAIMNTESSFNPSAISNRQAHGLMQIVPFSAGEEVHVYLHGERGQPDSASLLDPAFNIKYGATYLHLLLKRHLDGVVDPKVREYCAIAAYNIGPNAMLRVFDQDREQAIIRLNSLSPQEVYAVLMEKLPALETKNFLRKVVSLRDDFALDFGSAQDPL